MNYFKKRLDVILAGRKLHPWAKALGVSRGAAENMGKGVIPGSEILTAITRQENVSLNWLTTGKGTPFVVQKCVSPEEMSDLLDEYFLEQWWHINIYTDRSRLLFELELPASYEFKGTTINYTVREWLTGPVNEQVFNTLGAYRHKRFEFMFDDSDLDWQLVELTTKEMEKLASGYTSPFTLHGQPESGFGHWNDLGNLRWHKQLMDLFHQVPASSGELSIPLLRAVLKMVRQLAEDDSEALSIEEESRIVAATYKHAIKKGLQPKDLDPDVIETMMDML
ncbi:hypothetical protein [Endozoicomonas sp. ALC066]|uniref:hypothetical protein n=1 Tax=Endozoicomonas sp. ALC066 TaxID=3403078 RepID=UPI003BB620FB